jgi:hypothetical protein
VVSRSGSVNGFLALRPTPRRASHAAQCCPVDLFLREVTVHGCMWLQCDFFRVSCAPRKEHSGCRNPRRPVNRDLHHGSPLFTNPLRPGNLRVTRRSYSTPR